MMTILNIIYGKMVEEIKIYNPIKTGFMLGIGIIFALLLISLIITIIVFGISIIGLLSM